MGIKGMWGSMGRGMWFEWVIWDYIVWVICL